jgi:hypothetical protein
MRTWIEFLDHYDNMGSNNFMTIYYDEVISCIPSEVSRRLGTVCRQF